jgi:hypothetical protein
MRAQCRMLLDEAHAAVDDYRASLVDWPHSQRLDEGLFRAQLALALDHADMPEEADIEALQALTLGQQTGSRRTWATLTRLAHRRTTSPTSPGDQFLGAWQRAMATGAR